MLERSHTSTLGPYFPDEYLQELIISRQIKLKESSANLRALRDPHQD